MEKPKSKKEDKKINILLILDITGSMANQIAGVKKMIESYCTSHYNPETTIIHITTYTENSKGCYISHFTSQEKSDLINYIKKIKLATPPNNPEISASGEDGPENILGALAKIHKFIDPSSPILAFVITDAEPHYGFRESETAKREREVIDQLGFEKLEMKYDVFFILDQILDKHNGKLMVVPILYSSCNVHFYYQIALLTGGVVIKPKGNDCEALAKGLSSIVYGVSTSVMENRPAEISVEMYTGVESFFFYDVTGFELFDKEPECNNFGVLVEKKQDTKMALMGLFTTVLKIEGRKFRKRLKDVNFFAVKNSARLIILLAKSFTKNKKLTNAEMSLITSLIEEINEDLAPADAINFKSHMESLIPKLLSANPIKSSKTVSKSIITLETIKEAVEILPDPNSEEENTKQWLPSLMKLIHIRLINVNFPLDSFGKPDFMDSWSSSIKNYGPSILSAHDAMIIRNEDGLYKDPLNGEFYNAALPFVKEGDRFGSFMFEIFSDLNILDLVTTYLLSGNAEIFRNIWSGLAASLLFNLLKKKNVREIDDEMIDFLGYSIKLHYRPLASGVVKNLNKGCHLNPSDAIPKLVGGVLWFFNKNQEIEEKRVLEILTDLLEEWTCGVNRKFIKQEKNLKFKPVFSKDFVCQDPDGVKGDDLFKDLHPLENGGDEKKILKEGWGNDLRKKFKHPIKIQLENSWILFLKKFGLDSYKEKLNFDDIFIESFFFMRRKNRYNLLEDLKTHEKKDKLPKLEELFINWLKLDLKDQLIDLNKRRLSSIRKILINNIKKIKGTQEECNNLLKKNIITLFDGKVFNLGRMDVIEILPTLKKAELENLGFSLIFGNWTSQPPGQLYRHKEYLLNFFKEYPQIIIKINNKLKKRLLCTRELINRHGFSLNFQKVEPMEFTEEYGKQLIENKNSRKNYVDQMKKFKEYAVITIEKYKEKFYSELIETAIYNVEDSNNMEIEKKLICELVEYFENKKYSDVVKKNVLELLLKCRTNSRMRFKFAREKKKVDK